MFPSIEIERAFYAYMLAINDTCDPLLSDDSWVDVLEHAAQTFADEHKLKISGPALTLFFLINAATLDV